MTRRLAPGGVTLLAAAALATALALRGTGFHVVPASGGDWHGVTDVPGAGVLAGALAAGLGLAVAFRRLGLPVAPWLALGTAALPLLPAMLRVSLPLLFFQGAAITLVGIAAGVVALTRARPAFAERDPGAVLLPLGLAFYVLLGMRVPGPAGPQGDEPHYLTMAQSLLEDGDLDLANQFARREYRAFFAGNLEGHTSPASPPGRMYAVHMPGLAALILPAFAAGGYPGVRLLLAALSALTAWLVHRVVLGLTRSAPLALAAWAILALTPPLPIYSSAVYPETLAALATAVFLWTSRRDGDRLGVALSGLAAAALPWLHPKFLPLAVVGLGLTLARRGPRGARLAGAALFFASLLGFFAFLKLTYGRAALDAAYGPGFAADVSLARIGAGLPGLLFDRQFGLLAVGPVYALAVPGLLLLLRWRTGEALRAALLAGATLLVGGSFSMWWGGASPPARFVVPALPALAVGLALALRARPLLAAWLAGLGLAVVAIAADAPRALHNRPDGESGLLRVLAPALTASDALPSFIQGGATPWLLALTGLAALALAWRYRCRGAAAGVLAYLLVSAGLRQRPWIDARGAELAALEAWDGSNTWGPDGPLDPSRVAIPLELREAPWSVEATEIRNSGRLDLPPGLYDVVIDGTSPDAPPGVKATRVELTAGDLPLELDYLVGGRPTLVLPVTLPFGARRFALTAVGVQHTGFVTSARVVPKQLLRRRERALLPWPKNVYPDAYRVANGVLHVTALDRVRHEGAGFRVVGPSAAFLVEAPGAGVDVRIQRSQPQTGDELDWNGRSSRLGPDPDVHLSLRCEGAVRLGDAALIPVELAAQGAWIEFSGSSGATSATDVIAKSPGDLPIVTSTSGPAESR